MAIKPPNIAFLALLFIIVACSSSEYSSGAETNDSQSIQETISQIDSKYPYIGIPRIVIETENGQKIKDKETEVPAKLQVWGKDLSESDVLHLTIKGRGNTTWKYAKKPYTIKFESKESFLGMPEAKKWVLLANYGDRTLMRNSVAFELARKTSLAWTPSGKFAELILNGKHLGNYFVCEKIEAKKNRLELSKKSYLLEFDINYDEEYKFRTSVNDLPVNIKYPNDIDDSSFDYIRDYIDSAEYSLKQDANGTEYQKYLDQESFADYLIVYAMANNEEPKWPKSVYMHKDHGGKLTAGPVWDFDWATFNIKKSWFSNWNAPIFKNLNQKNAFKDVLRSRWEADKVGFEDIFSYIDSLADYISESNQRNIKLWPINLPSGLVGDEDKTFEEAVDMLKKDIRKSIDELDTLIRDITTYSNLE